MEFQGDDISILDRSSERYFSILEQYLEVKKGASLKTGVGIINISRDGEDQFFVTVTDYLGAIINIIFDRNEGIVGYGALRQNDGKRIASPLEPDFLMDDVIAVFEAELLEKDILITNIAEEIEDMIVDEYRERVWTRVDRYFASVLQGKRR